ncbi:MAG: hypothetical protein BGO49_13110 [Planctomycetales bacterium 71-10]|nr:MAG: hypothetical protein BGO49_13110 [Planctomycetales bacterium 71-10]
MSDRQAIIAKTAEWMHGWKTIKLDVAQTLEHSAEALAIMKKDGGALAKRTDYHYEETATGERSLSVVFTLEDGAVQRTDHTFDGRKGTTLRYEKGRSDVPTSATIGKSFSNEGSNAGTDRPTPLKYQYVEKLPLYEALAKARDMGEAEVDGQACDRFMFDDVVVGQTRQNLLYSIRRDGAVPVRIESFDGPDPTTARKLGTWEAQKVDVVQGRPIVVKSTLTALDRDGNVRMTVHSEVGRVAFDEAIAKETFRPVIAPGVEIHDTITGKVQTPPRKAAEAAPRPPDVKGADAVADPPRVAEAVGVAEQPVGWNSVATNAFLVLGGVLLIAGLALKLPTLFAKRPG